MLVELFWDIFPTRWDPLFAIDSTILKLAPVAKWCSVGNFLQGTIVIVLCGPRPSIEPRVDMDPDLLLVLKLIWFLIYH